MRSVGHIPLDPSLRKSQKLLRYRSIVAIVVHYYVHFHYIDNSAVRCVIWRDCVAKIELGVDIANLGVE